jgi:hypothetical protein
MSEPNERAARYSDLFGGVHDHTPDCAFCPFCAGIAMVRETNPEVIEHLAAAARELVIAAGLFLEDAGDHIGARPDGTWARAGDKAPDPEQGDDPKVRRIDIG